MASANRLRTTRCVYVCVCLAACMRWPASPTRFNQQSVPSGPGTDPHPHPTPQVEVCIKGTTVCFTRKTDDQNVRRALLAAPDVPFWWVEWRAGGIAGVYGDCCARMSKRA